MLETRIVAADHPARAAVTETPSYHNCSDFTILSSDGEMVCIRCGKVDEEETARHLYEVGEQDGRASTTLDHNPGNMLFDSQTMQSKYISRINPGVAMLLNHPRGRDAQGKRIKPQLKDPYRTGVLADPTVGFHIECDELTGKKKVVCSRYDAPLLPFIKEKALQRCVSYQLDVVEQTLIAKELKRIYSNLFLSEMVDYAVIAALLRYGHLLPSKSVKELERELIVCIEIIREKILCGCATKRRI